jgi:hypothetical protein
VQEGQRAMRAWQGGGHGDAEGGWAVSFFFFFFFFLFLFFFFFFWGCLPTGHIFNFYLYFPQDKYYAPQTSSQVYGWREPYDTIVPKAKLTNIKESFYRKNGVF